MRELPFIPMLVLSGILGCMIGGFFMGLIMILDLLFG